MAKRRTGLGSGVSRVPDVQLAQEGNRPLRAKPFQVKPRGRYVARVASPSEGAALLAEMIAAGDLPRGAWRINRTCGMWQVRLVALGRGQRRKPWLRFCLHFCDAVRALQEMRAVSDALESKLLGEAEAALRSASEGQD